MIFQSFNLVSTMSALENVTLSMMFAGVPKPERDQRAAQLLESMGLGGRQRHGRKNFPAANNSALRFRARLRTSRGFFSRMNRQEIWTAGHRGKSWNCSKELNERERKAIILVTHDANLAAQYAHRTITLMDGMRTEGSPS